MINKKFRRPVVIAVDGPAASGKGTLSNSLANHFGFARLDTGLIYRALGLKVLGDGTEASDKHKVILLANQLSFDDLNQENLRSEKVGAAASRIAAIPDVRAVLLKFQRDFAAHPPVGKSGVVLDGRDIGTIVCPNANFKIFLIADKNVRATRRFKELQERGLRAIYSQILRDMVDRDARDSFRSVAPLEPAKDAFVLDTSNLSVDATFVAALRYISTQNKD
ncbi:uncharacterized protein METZ01_LOCUS432442 [marine metagenome]|uniref:(d)CMP kinase n=1 Tax=marine metagenome TaxID=408172 RepID=A0A382YAP3_9ZZZZ